MMKIYHEVQIYTLGFLLSSWNDSSFSNFDFIWTWSIGPVAQLANALHLQWRDHRFESGQVHKRNLVSGPWSFGLQKFSAQRPETSN